VVGVGGGGGEFLARGVREVGRLCEVEGVFSEGGVKWPWGLWG